MGDRLKSFLLFLLLLSVAILAYLLSRAQDEADSWRSSYTAQVDSAKIWRNDLGQSQAEVQSAYTSIETLKQQHTKDIDDLRASAKEISGLKKSLSNLQSLTVLTTTTTNEVKEVLRDTVIAEQPAKTFAYSDQWLTIDGYFLRDSVSLTSTVRDDIRIVQFWKRRNIFSSRILYTDVISQNPHSSILTLHNITIRPKPLSRIVVAAGVGVGWPQSPFFGVVIGYKLIEF